MFRLTDNWRPILGFVAFITFGLAAQVAQAISLPICTAPTNCLQFGSFNVYDLGLLNLQAGYSATPSSGDPYYVPASYGQIKNYTIAGINNGQNQNPAGIDGAYNTPSPNNTTNANFSTISSAAYAPNYVDNGGVADPGGPGQFANDSANSWDATVSTLVGAAGLPLTGYFAFNETGSGNGLLTTDLLIWADFRLVSASGTTQDFYLGGNQHGTFGPKTADLPSDPYAANSKLIYDPTTDMIVGTDTTGNGVANDFSTAGWVYVHAGVCVNNTTNAFTGFPDLNGNCADPNSSVKVNNNLGQNQAAFAFNSPSLDAALASGNWQTLQVIWKMGYINGGGETAWFAPTSIAVPEPDTIALMGFGLLALGIAMRRKTKSSSK